MKKKKGFAVGAATTAFLVLTVSAFAGSPQYEGYEAFKEVMEKHRDSDDLGGSMVGDFEIIDNGESVLKLSADFVGSKDELEMSGSVNIESDEINKALDFYGNDGTMYIYDEENNDVYVGNHEEHQEHQKYDRNNYESKMTEKEEAFLDLMMDDYKDDFDVVVSHDGSKEISFELTKEEIPVALNLLISMADEKGDRDPFRQDMQSEKMALLTEYPLISELAQLQEIKDERIVENRELEYVYITLKVDKSNDLQGMALDITVSGEDEEGFAHLVTFKGDIDFELNDEQRINEITLEGKDVYELPSPDEYDREGKMQMRHR